MAVRRLGQLHKVLSETTIDNRFITWLWLYFKNLHPQLDPGEFQSHGMNERMVEFISRYPNLKQEIEVTKIRLLLPNERLHWITNDERQNKWLINFLSWKIGPNQVNLLHTLSGRNLVLAMIDTWNIDPNQKLNEISLIETSWNQHKHTDNIFRWFIGPDENQKYTLAWELISKKNHPHTLNKEPFKSHQELLIFFDQTNFHLAEKTLLIDAIKKRWSQNKYRQKMIEKKQYNFILSNKSIARLDNLADKYDLKRVEILEILLEMEDKKGVYIQAKLNPLAES
ncbi:hypothetical protein JFU49_02125 [Pseudomonas sp. TH03]|uniref:hypothetical protein n=1 Tax=Pseudomonas sp. TH03 TaxID=2796369 RepID=UPI0019144CF6|nr:hypothetical protein [Pseudomonas sp. TH03]MBK5549085.1 hypothetical protein [Pseudomonas sp. TH03]